MITTIDSMSDLHLEFADLSLPGGDILILAGDIMTVRHIIRPMLVPDIYKRYVRFCKEELIKYNRVFMVLGNHEHYGAELHDSRNWFPKFFAEHAPSTTLLDNSTVVHNGIAFIGSTLWTNCGNERDAMIIRNSMNDYRVIRTMSDNRVLRNLSIEDVRGMHIRARRYIYTATQKYRTLPCVLITHHAPCLLSGKNDYRFGGDLDAAYYSNLLHNLLPRRPNIMLCCHGHTHVPARYMLGNAEVISNPRGYAEREATARNFDPQAGRPSIDFWAVTHDKAD